MAKLKEVGYIARAAAQGAIDNIGVEEEGENRGKWIETYQRSTGNSPGEPWCASFVYYRLITAQAKIGLDWVKLPKDFVRSGYTPDWKNWAVKNGLWIPVANAQGVVERGDLVCFYSSKKKRIFHIGIVISAWDWGVRSVEGNTSPGRPETGVNADGDGVYLKKRNWSELGRWGGFIRIPY